MRVVLFANNSVGLEVTKWIRQHGDEIVAVVVHPVDRSRYRREIIQASGVNADAIIDGAVLREPAAMARLAALQPDIGVSAFFGHILREDLLSLFPAGVVNLHPSYLPFNRGHSPNVWSLIEEAPAGVSLHYVDAGVDTGDIIARRVVPTGPIDTGETLYRRLELESLRLLRDTWPDIVAGTGYREPQSREAGTAHRGRDLEEIDRIELDRTYTARQLINILRARTFPPYRGAYVEVDGKRVYMRLQLWSEDIPHIDE